MEPAGQLADRRRRDEDQCRRRDRLADRPRTLEVDLEDDIIARGELCIYVAAQRAIQVATVVYPLEELPLVDRAPELLDGQEPVVVAVGLAGPRRSRGRRHGGHDTLQRLAHQADDGPLPGARRPRDDVDRRDDQLPKKPSSSAR